MLRFTMANFVSEDGDTFLICMGIHCTYLELGWLDAEGNHEFLVYAEDHNEPGSGTDKVWFVVNDKDGNVISAMSMDSPSSANTTPLQGENIVVPHGGKAR